jgi:hypothetical protein
MEQLTAELDASELRESSECSFQYSNQIMRGEEWEERRGASVRWVRDIRLLLLLFIFL